MKLKFKSQDFQTAAVNAVVGLFRGQEKRQGAFAAASGKQLSFAEGIVGNALAIEDEQLFANMQDVQKKQGLPLSTDLSGKRFCIEMETGTGKTYVYTKTAFELNKQYGFTKFIVVVPSIAIREGVFKSFQTTASHFAAQYGNTPARCFIYDSKKLSQVRLFAMSSGIEIMIINIDAFKKAENAINQEQDRLGGETAMRYIQGASPIVVIDEPQSVDSTPKAKEAIASLNPMCVLCYSATHREKTNLLYRLASADAYRMGLVKQICVSSTQIESDFNRPYIRLVSVSSSSGFSAKLEIDKVAKSGKAGRRTITVKPGADLFALSGARALYDGYRVAGIDCQPGLECIEFANGETLYLGKAFAGIGEASAKRAQIRRTVEAHLDKELRLTAKGIKVLTLFFVDEVAKYRAAGGGKGAYAEMFEECYAELMALPKFAPLKEQFPADASSIHNGYFSQDRKGNWKDAKGDGDGDRSAYFAIMKDKEWLLSFECPLRFIFSHSALKEGWDNPNVFQVCTLVEQRSAFTARQKIGRGLRLAVSQDGERIEDRNVNILHIMANESFAEFASALQQETWQETGVKYGALQPSLFAGLAYLGTVAEEKTVSQEQALLIADYAAKAAALPEPFAVSGPPAFCLAPPSSIALPELAPVVEKAVAAAKMGDAVTAEKVAGLAYAETRHAERAMTCADAQELLSHFERKGYVAKTGEIRASMHEALASGTLDLPAKYEASREMLETAISKASACLPVQDSSKEVRVRLKKEALISPAFLALWEKIKGRTAYRVQLDEAALKKRCLAELAKSERVAHAKIVSRTARIDVEQSGVGYTQTELRTSEIDHEAHSLPDFLRMVDNACFLPKRTIAELLIESGRIPDFLMNPQRMAEVFIEAVRSAQSAMEIGGIRYAKLEGEERCLQEMFGSAELPAYLGRNAIRVQRSVYDHVIYGSASERAFAAALDSDPDVRMFFKIPDMFKIETPIGPYSPDWAVCLDKNGEQHLCFALETKGGSRANSLRTAEQQKMHCGKQHFAALNGGVELCAAQNWQECKAGI
jgi:type III restriction enzyme